MGSQNKKETVKVSRDKVIELVAKMEHTTTDNIGSVFDSIEEVMITALSGVNENRDVLVKLFNGISVRGTYLPERLKKNNLTGKIIKVASNIKLKPAITKTFSDKIISHDD